jgi:molybdenum cofactor cytidylyltransferase
MSVAAIVLAAGRARRYGAAADDSKVLAMLDGVSLVRHVVTTALASRASPVIVVTGQAAAAVDAALSGLPVALVHNPNYPAGMAGSLQAGLAALPDDVAGVLVLLADMPLVRSATLDALIAWFEGEAAKGEAAKPDAVLPTFEGRVGNPALLARAMFPALRDLRGDEGARKLLGQSNRLVAMCPVDDRGIEVDVDTRAALAALGGGSG